MSDQKEEKPVIEQIKSDYLKFFQDWLNKNGLNPFIGRIMQLLRFEDRSFTQGELQEALNLSKATISRNLKVMNDMNLLKIDILSSNEKSSDKYSYELKENSLFYIFSKFLKNIYESFNRRTEDNKIVMNKINELTEDQRDTKDIQNLLRIMREEEVVFTAMIDKFERLIQDLEDIMLKKS